MKEDPKLFTVLQFTEKYPAFTTGGLRFQIFHAEKNGLNSSGAIIRIGRKILIDADKYFEWVYAQNGVSS